MSEFSEKIGMAAGNNFKSGYNCCEAIVETFRKQASVDIDDNAFRMCSGFGGGIGHALRHSRIQMDLNRHSCFTFPLFQQPAVIHKKFLFSCNRRNEQRDCCIKHISLCSSHLLASLHYFSSSFSSR